MTKDVETAKSSRTELMAFNDRTNAGTGKNVLLCSGIKQKNGNKI